ncbi:MAG: aminopeptidase, partial [Terrimicrobiaceae bacterium]|nr:aminopeptidase [Terrimicrobiaceae bacterium]
MKDPRHDSLARVLVRHSTRLRKGDHVLIELFDAPEAIGVAIIRAVREVGAIPFLQIHRSVLSREMQRGIETRQLEVTRRIELARMKLMQAYIAVRGSHNISEMSDVPEDRARLASRMMQPVLNHRVNHTRWVVLRWPTSAMAQQAAMSTEAFEDFFFRACSFDYSRM